MCSWVCLETWFPFTHFKLDWSAWKFSLFFYRKERAGTWLSTEVQRPISYSVDGDRFCCLMTMCCPYVLCWVAVLRPYFGMTWVFYEELQLHLPFSEGCHCDTKSNRQISSFHVPDNLLLPHWEETNMPLSYQFDRTILYNFHVFVHQCSLITLTSKHCTYIIQPLGIPVVSTNPGY